MRICSVQFYIMGQQRAAQQQPQHHHMLVLYYVYNARVLLWPLLADCV